MQYLLGHIAILLLFAAALGVFFGWMLRNVATRAQLRALDQEWSARTRNLQRQRDRLQVHTEKLSKRITDAQVEQARTRTLIETLKNRVPHDAGTSLADVQAQVSELEQRAQGQAKASQALREKLTTAEQANRTLENQLEASEGAREAAEQELGDLRQQSDQLREALAKAQVSTVASRAPKRPPAARRDQGQAPEGLWKDPPRRVDKLQRINGIGPVLERLLNRLGIYQFRQLARMSDANVSWLGNHINSFPQRIEREDWVGQAARLHEEAYPDEAL